MQARGHHLSADVRTDVAEAALRVIAGKLAESSGSAKDHGYPDRTTRINKVCAIPGKVPDQYANTGVFEPRDCTSADVNMVPFDREPYGLLGKRYANFYEKVTYRGE
ncbi:hypothetical protein N9B25_01350 [bacterium]|nr:hypothetical protein [bacterium]